MAPETSNPKSPETSGDLDPAVDESIDGSKVDLSAELPDHDNATTQTDETPSVEPTDSTLNIEEAEGPGSLLPEENSSSKQDTLHSGPDPDQEKDSRQEIGGDQELEDAFGEALSDDELWDEGGGLDEIPLFDEIEDEEGSEESGPKAGEAEEQAPDQPDLKGVEDEGRETGKTRSDRDEAPGPEETGESQRASIGFLPTGLQELLPWVITGIAVTGTLVSFVLLYTLISSPPAHKKNIRARQTAQKDVGPVSPPQTTEPLTPSIERIGLSPFLIPGNKDGQMVFFKLQVELIVPDVATKHEILRKEALVRDIIYRQLKGIEIVQGARGNFLWKYERSILNQLNKELAPLEIQDLKLVGFLLK